MSLYIDPAHIKLGRTLVERYQATPDLADFFGPRISLLTMAELEMPIRKPLLTVIAQVAGEIRVIGGNVLMDVSLLTRVYLPYPTRASHEIAVPAAPTATPVSAAAAASFRLSEFGPWGESFAGPPVVSTIGATLALPTKKSGSLGFRVWRTPAGLTRYHWAGVARAATWTDTAPDTHLGDGLAPDLDLGASIMAAVGTAIYGQDVEVLADGTGKPQAYGFIQRKANKPAIAVDRNCLLYEYAFVNQTKVNPRTNEIDLNGNE